MQPRSYHADVAAPTGETTSENSSTWHKYEWFEHANCHGHLPYALQAWFRTWDNKLNRRRYGEYAEDYAGEGSDSCGIHASGAGFDKVDKIEYYVPPSY